MAYTEALAERIRRVLAATGAVREKTMFGGLSFMVNEKMVVSVRGDGDLLVRCDPARTDGLLTLAGARQAEMGAGRSMGRGWILVGEAATATADGLDFWLGVALEYHSAGAGARTAGFTRATDGQTGDTLSVEEAASMVREDREGH